MTDKKPAIDDLSLLLSYMPERIAIVDRKQVWCAPPDGLWENVPLKMSEPEISGLMCLMTKAREMDGIEAIIPTTAAVQHCALRVHQLTRMPQIPNIRYLASKDFNRRNTLALNDGSTLVLNAMMVVKPAEMPELLITRKSGVGIDWQPDLLNHEAPPDVAELLKHYTPAVINRMAYHIAFSPTKTIDLITSPIVDSGKDTLGGLMVAAFPGEVIMRALDEYMSAQGGTYTMLETDLCDYRLVFGNEGEKLDGAIPSRLMTKITGERLTTSGKWKQIVQGLRNGNFFMLCNHPPHMENSPGVNRRMWWAYKDGWPQLPEALRDRTRDDDVIAWFAAYIINKAAEYLEAGHTGYQAENSNLASAKELALLRRSHEADLLADFIEPAGKADFVTGDQIRQHLSKHGVKVQHNAKYGKWVLEVAPEAYPGRPPDPKGAGRGKRGYYGVRALKST